MNTGLIGMMFGIPFYKSKVDSTKYKKQQIISNIENNYKINSNRNNWDYDLYDKSNLHHSFGDFDNSEFISIDYSDLIPLYVQHTKKFFDNFFEKEILFKITIENYTCMTSGQYMIEHDHGDSQFSAVHYLKFNSKVHKSTLYMNPAIWANYTRYTLSKKFQSSLENNVMNSWIQKNWHFDTEEDDFVITPSLLRHSVPESDTKELRMTIVMNIYILNE